MTVKRLFKILPLILLIGLLNVSIAHAGSRDGISWQCRL